MARIRLTMSCASSSLPSRRVCTSSVKTSGFASASAAARVHDEDVMQVSRKERQGNNIGTATSSASANAAPANQSARSTRDFLLGLRRRFPFRRATSLMDRMDRIFGSVFPFSASPLLRARTTNHLPLDVMENDKCFKLRVELPGYAKDDVKLSINNGDLTLKAEHSAEESSEEDWSSGSYGAFNARISLPDKVDQAAIKAVLKNGVLNVMVPKAESIQKKLEIRVD